MFPCSGYVLGVVRGRAQAQATAPTFPAKTPAPVSWPRPAVPELPLRGCHQGS